MTADNEKYDGVVIWYNERRGYGFVRFDKNEIFLHHSASSLFRLETIYPGDQLTVNLSENDCGPVIKEILAVDVQNHYLWQQTLNCKSMKLKEW